MGGMSTLSLSLSATFTLNLLSLSSMAFIARACVYYTCTIVQYYAYHTPPRGPSLSGSPDFPAIALQLIVLIIIIIEIRCTLTHAQTLCNVTLFRIRSISGSLMRALGQAHPNIIYSCLCTCTLLYSQKMAAELDPGMLCSISITGIMLLSLTAVSSIHRTDSSKFG